MGALSDALLGRLPWTDRAVLRGRDELMSLNNEQLERHLENQRELAMKQAIRGSLFILLPWISLLPSQSPSFAIHGHLIAYQRRDLTVFCLIAYKGRI